MRLQSLDVGVAQGDFFPVEALELRLELAGHAIEGI